MSPGGTVMAIEDSAILQKAWSAFPDLNCDGLNSTRQRHEFLETDADMLTTSVAFMQRIDAARIGRLRPSSYFLKHAAERWGGATGHAPYVSNGALIAAAVYLDFPVKPYQLGRHPNA